MAVRPSMVTLIQQVRTLIADPTGAAFDDQTIQDVLDLRRTERRWILLQPSPTFQPGNGTVFLNFYADAQAWEDDIVLQDASFATITPTVSEPLVGHWSFAQQPNGIGVRATGKTYDLYGAAADLLERWAASVKLDFDVVSGKDQYARQQKFAMLRSLAGDYRERALPAFARMVQSDAMPEFDGGGVVYPSVSGGW